MVEAIDSGVRGKIAFVRFEGLVRDILRGENRSHAHSFGPLDIGEPVVPHVNAFPRGNAEIRKKDLERLGMGFDKSNIARDDYSLENLR